mgnify:CR=1 FL=1
MKKGTTVDILGALSVIVGFCLLLYNPDYTVIPVTSLEVNVIRTAGVVLIIVGMIIPAISHSHKN